MKSPKSPRVLTFSLSRLRSARAVCAVLAMAGSASSHAATFNWDPAGDQTNSGGAGTWDLTSLFWNDDGAAPNVAWPNANDSAALFGGVGDLITINTGVAGTGVTANSLTFNTGGYTISSDETSEVITLAGATPTITVTNQADTATINSGIAGVSLTKAGLGTLVLGGVNTYSGPTTITGGTLSISASENLGNASATNNIVLSGGGMLQSTGAVVDLGTNRSITVDTGGGAISVSTDNELRVSAPVTSTAGNDLTVWGGGSLVLGGTTANATAGAIRVHNGTVMLNKPAGTDAIGSGGLVIQSGNSNGFAASVVRLSANDQINDTGKITLNANGGNIAHLDLAEFSETIGALEMSSTTFGSATISTGASGVLTLTSDIVLNNNRNATGNTGREVLITGTGSYNTIEPSGTLDLGGVNRKITVNTTNAPTIANTYATIETLIQNGGIVKEGNAGLLLGNGFNTFAGGITVNGGEVVFREDGALGDFANTILLNGGGLAYISTTADWDPFRVINIGENGGSFGGSRAIRINDPEQITGSGTLTRNGTGNVGLDISVPNTGFTGNIVINSAVLELKHAQGVGTGENQTITVNGGQVSLAETGGTGAVVLPHPITLNGGALAFNNRIGGTYAGNVNVTADSAISVKDFYQNANRGGAISGVLSGSGVITVSGATGTLVGGTPNFGSVLLTNGGNTFDGTFRINSGAQVRAVQSGQNSLSTATIELNGGGLGLVPTVSAAGANPGLFGRFYNSPKIGTSSAGVVGGFDFGAETPVSSLNNTTIDFPSTPPSAPGLNTTSLTAIWTGVLEVTNGGSYSFFTRSDDGSMIYVDGQMVVANDYAQGPTERTGAIHLTPGFHSIVIKYGQGGGGATMSANYSGPDTLDIKSLLGSVENSLTNNGANLFAPTTMSNAINVTANSDIDLAAANATSSGTITFSPSTGLRVTGVTGSETLTQSGAVVLDGVNTITTGITLTGVNGTTAGHNHNSAGADMIISGNISEAFAGSGLTKDGPRTLTLTGNNTFTGPVYVAGGTLVGNTSSLPTAIINDARLVFDQTTDGTFNQEISGTGTLIKRGNATLTINSNNGAYAGTTEVREGTLTGTGTLGGNVSVYAGGTIAGKAGSTFTVGGLTLQPKGSANFDVTAPSTTALISTDSFASVGSRINITSSSGLGAGTYRLIDYTGTALTTAQFAGIGIGNTPTGFYYGLVNNAADTAIDLIVETPGALNTWTGSASGVWDTTTAGNWSAGAFANGQQVTFGDGVTNRNISGGTVSPQRIVVNGSAGNDYTISNVIGGTLAGGLVKSGANTLRLTGANTFSGAITIDGGTLAASISSTESAIGAGAVSLNGGTLEINGSASTATNGLFGRYFNTNNTTTTALNFDLPAVAAQVDNSINFVFNESNKPAGGAVGNDESDTNTSWRQFSMDWTGKVNITTEGQYAFFTGGDDGSRLWIDGKLVAVNDGGHGEVESGGSVYLTPGLHDIRMVYSQGGGGASARLRYAGPGIPKQIIPSRALFTPESADENGTNNAIQLGNTVNVAGNSSINLAGQQFTGVQVGLLNLSAGSTLNVSGGTSKNLAATTTLLDGGTITLNTEADVRLGQVLDNGDAVTVNKLGSERLILDNGSSGPDGSELSSGTLFNVQGGTLVAVGSNVSGNVNPLGSAKVQLNGGSLILDSKVGGVTFDTPVEVLKSGTITAQTVAQTTTLSSGAGVSVASGATLTLETVGGSRGSFGGYGGQTSAGATFLVSSAISGAGDVTIRNKPLNGAQSPVNGTVILAGNNTYTGLTVIEPLPHAQSQVELRGAATFQTTSGVNETGKVVLTNTRLNLNNNAGGNLDDRIPDAWPIEMTHGTLRFDGNSGAASSETIGAITLKSGENNLFSGTTNGSNPTTLTIASITREGRSTLRFVGNNLGNGFTNTNRILFTDATGITSNLVGGGGLNGSTNVSILPWAYAAQNTFVTYDIDGVRSLNTFEFATPDIANNDDNVRLEISEDAVLAGRTVNSFIIDNTATAATRTVTLNGTLNVTSGALLLVGSAGSNQKGVTIAPDATNGGIINFGDREGVITVNRVGSSITAQISGTQGLTVTGDNQLLLNNAGNDFTGPITINGAGSPVTGTNSLAAQNDSSLGNFENDLFINGGGFRFNSAFMLGFDRDVTIGPAGATIDTGGGNGSIEGVLSGTGPLIKVGGNTLTLGGFENTHEGDIIVLNGQVINQTIPTGNIETHGTYNFRVFDDATYNGTITGTGAVAKSGLGALTLTGDNSYAQGTNVLEGTLKGTTANLRNGINISSGASVVLDQATDGTFTGVLDGPGIFIKEGNSTITFANASSHSGGTMVNGGTIRTANGASLGTGAVTLGDAKLHITETSSSGASIRVASANSTLQVDAGKTFSMGGIQGDPFVTGGTLTKTGGGTVEMIAPGDFTGNVNLAEGRIVMDDFSALGASTTTLSSNTVLSLRGEQDLSGFVGFTTNGTAALLGDTLRLTSGANNQAGSAFFGGKRAVSEGFSVSFSYQATGGNGTTMADGFTFTLQNDFRGTTALGATGGALGYSGITPSAAVAFNLYTGGGSPIGTGLRTNGGGAGYTASDVNFASGEFVDITITYDPVALTLTGTITDRDNPETPYTNVFTGVDLASIFANESAYLGFTGATGGVHSTQLLENFQFEMAGTSSLASFVNTLVVPDGQSPTVEVAAASHGNNAAVAALNIGTGSTFNVTSGGLEANTDYRLKVSGATTLAGAATVNVANNGTGVGILELTGGISGSANITKTGDGRLSFVGDSSGTYTGNVTLTNGSLHLAEANISASAIIAELNTEILGTGILARIQGSGTIISPSSANSGEGVGKLTLAGDLSLTSSSVVKLDIGKAIAGAQPVAGDFDSIVASSISLTGDSRLELTINSGIEKDDIFTIILNNGASAVSGLFAGLPNEALFTMGGQVFQISYFDDASTPDIFETEGGNDISLLAVPEPTSTGALIAGLGMLLGGRRFRRSRR